jgi:thiol-disulfide isomerase/thioredoxin
LKKLLITAITFFISAIVFAQSTKKISSDGLQQYIHSSNHPIVVNFWATTCGPCIRELVYFQNTIEKYKDSNVELLLISLDIPKFYPQNIDAFVKEKKIKASVFWLSEKDIYAFCKTINNRWTADIPATLFVNNKSNIYTFFERQLTDQQFEIEMKKLVKD